MIDLLKKITPRFVLGLYHQVWPFLGTVIYRFPSRKVKVIGITGTNGKTTVAHLTSHILEQAGYKVASISSLRFKIGDREWKNTLKMTMPGRMKVQKFLREAVDSGCKYVVMEVTSEGIRQYRHKFIDFEVAVFTNLTPEHIESHGGFENYKKAKGELFKIAKKAIVNSDDENGEYFASLCPGSVQYYSAKHPYIDIVMPSTLPGDFNLANALSATYVGLSQGIDMQIIKKALADFRGVPGRMEIVIKEPYTVIVDYAHTPDALEKVYKTIRENYHLATNNDKLVCVLGAAGGGRDKWKRPELGKISAQYCDQIILTDEDPYSENPDKILSEIESGIIGSHPPTHNKVLKILDRREAIKKALQIAGQGDVVAITGKGAEPLLMKRAGGVSWDDREVVREEFYKLTKFSSLKR